MANQIIKRIASKILRLANQYSKEQLRTRFNLPPTVSYEFLSLEGNILIGDHTYLNDYTRVDTGVSSKVVIGKHCAIGRFVHITSKTHNLSQPTTDDLHPEIAEHEADVLIGDFVWIGDKVTVLPGVQIGSYAIIAAHAVVTSNVKPFEIVGGVPARHIRFNQQHYKYSSDKG